MARFKNLVLTELGNTTDSYDYYLAKNGDKVSGSFHTSENKYLVEISKRGPWLLFNFGIGKHMSAGVTDEGAQFKVMATIMDIAKEVWEDRDEFFGGEIRGFFFDSVAKPDEEPGNTVRARLYKKFIKKRFPNVDIEKSGGSYKVIPTS